MELQTCPHRTTEVAALGPELEDGNRGGIAFTLLFEASLDTTVKLMSLMSQVATVLQIGEILVLGTETRSESM